MLPSNNLLLPLVLRFLTLFVSIGLPLQKVYNLLSPGMAWNSNAQSCLLRQSFKSGLSGSLLFLPVLCLQLMLPGTL